MAIRMMTSEDKAGNPNVEIVRNYRGHEEGLIHHGKGCPLYNKLDTSGKHSPECVRRTATYGVDQHGNKRDYDEFCGEPFGPLYMETTYVGKVVSTGEINGRDDSDFYAWVIDPEAESGYTQITYASTRGWTYPNSARVDATAEEIAAFVRWREGLARVLVEAQRTHARDQGDYDMGERVKVVRGRKVPIGTEGKVIWKGKNQYSGKPRLGILADDGTRYFTDGSNVQAS